MLKTSLSQAEIDISKLKRAKELISKAFEDKMFEFITQKMTTHKAEMLGLLKHQKVSINHQIQPYPTEYRKTTMNSPKSF